MQTMKDLLTKFFLNQCKNNEFENEFDLQFELACYLRQELSNYTVKIEKRCNNKQPVNSGSTVKSRIDIHIKDNAGSEAFGIELKYPTKQQYPEQMFKSIMDIEFMEQLMKRADRPITKGFCIALISDPLFYEGKNTKPNSIYEYFRCQKPIHGIILKPTGNKECSIKIDGTYTIEWESIKDTKKFYILEINA
jgi:hypothetical protein